MMTSCSCGNHGPILHVQSSAEQCGVQLASECNEFEPGFREKPERMSLYVSKPRSARTTKYPQNLRCGKAAILQRPGSMNPAPTGVEASINNTAKRHK